MSLLMNVLFTWHHLSFFDKLLFLNLIFVKSIHVRAREYACVSVRAGVCVYLLASIYMYNINVQNIFCVGHVRYMETLMVKSYLYMQYNFWCGMLSKHVYDMWPNIIFKTHVLQCLRWIYIYIYIKITHTHIYIYIRTDTITTNSNVCAVTSKYYTRC